MKGDFTRFTHKSPNHFNRVYQQQGRVELDSDFNEYVDLTTDLKRTEAVDIIGQAGVPKGNSFQVDVVNSNTDLLIHQGHMYVDGILCVLEGDLHYNAQPDGIAQPALNPVLNRKDLVYLHVMERHITWVENNLLLEPALQGADTCTRVQTIAQVRIQSGIAANSSCGVVPNWPPAASGGLLTTGVQIVGPAPNPCVLPESGGFRGTENRLYRVEIHTGGSMATAKFKWSRDNGAVVVPVEFIGETHRVQAKTLGRDQVIGLKKGDWVELASDTTDLTPSAGTLAQIIDITPDLKIQLSKDISTHNGQSHPKLRRWDQGSDEVPVAATAIALEDGITVSFSGANFKAGDAWMFTARIGSDVEILTSAPPSSILHHYAALAIITWVPDPNNAAALVASVESCRPQFPPLTNITAEDVKFNGGVCKFGPNVKTVQQAIDALCGKQEECCTVVVRPGPNWTDVFSNIPATGVHLCFRPGSYTLNNKIEIHGKATMVVSGAGDAAKVIAINDECTLRFINCSSVTVRDFSAEGRVAQLGSGPNNDGILGVISIKNATDVLVENCRLTSADGPHRTTACLSVHTANRAVVRDNRFVAGVQQVGVLLSNVNNVRAEGNLIMGTSRTVGAVVGLLNDLQFLAGVRTRLITNLFVGTQAPPSTNNTVATTVGGQPVQFLAPQSHVISWINLLNQNPMPGLPSKTNIEDHILGLANQILQKNAFPSFAGLRAAILGNVTPSAQGITVGGTVGESILIHDNRVSGFIEGIHVGLSARNPNISVAERVGIHDNRVTVTLGTGSTRGRHGIYVGNVNSLNLRGNRLTLERPAGAQNMQIDGIRVFGRLGRSLIVRENHLTGFNIGIRFELRGATPPTPMWLINDNLAEGSNPPVSAPNVANKANNWG